MIKWKKEKAWYFMQNLLLILLLVCSLFMLFSKLEGLMKKFCLFKRIQLDHLLELLKEQDVADISIDYDDFFMTKKRAIFINGEVNNKTSNIVIRKLLYLSSVNSDTPINLYISTNGGNISSVLGIVDIIRSLDTEVNTIAIGSCYSAGTYLLMSGTGKRLATSNTIISVHINTHSGNEHKFAFDFVNNLRIKNFWNKNPNLPKEWYLINGDKTFYLTPKEAIAFGIIDEIIQPLQGQTMF
jgi:ATP-dependent Clp protease protease subunit